MAPPLTVAPPPEATPGRYEQDNVHAVYNMIATHFSATRYKPWPVIATFLSSIPAGSLGFDAGCGNGKYLPAWDDAFCRAMMIGLDRSDNLAALARRVGYIKEGQETVDDGRRREVMVGDVLDAGGLRSGSMDFAISIATLHHLSTPERRLQTVRTLLRVISPTSGRAMIFVWALEQGDAARRIVPSRIAPDLDAAGSAATTEGEGEGEPAKASGTRAKAQDVFVPWVLSKQAPKTVKDALKGEGALRKQRAKGGKKGRGPTPSAPVLEQQDPSTSEAASGSTSTASPDVDAPLASLSLAALPSTSSAPPPPATLVAPSPPPSPPKVYQRYYHLFREGELPALVREACALDGISLLSPGPDGQERVPAEGESWLRIVLDGYDRDNWYVEVRRGVGPESNA